MLNMSNKLNLLDAFDTVHCCFITHSNCTSNPNSYFTRNKELW
jgi:hypothetical protein